MITAIAPGKINLYFQVGPKRVDGYHDVVSLYQAVDIFEKVTVEPSSSWLVEAHSTRFNVEDVPTDESNLVVKAAKELAKEVGIEKPQPMKFTLEKNIPTAGGMAGGSADAAASLLALNEAWCLGLEQKDLLRVAAKVGADVPFAILGGTAIGTSTGTELVSVPQRFDKEILLVFTGHKLSTKSVFDRFDEIGEHDALPEISDPDLLFEKLGYNNLTQSAFELVPELAALAKVDLGLGAPILSGSGPTLWYSSSDAQAIRAAQAMLKNLGYESLASRPTSLGSALI